jgi:hypothetical protein
MSEESTARRLPLFAQSARRISGQQLFVGLRRS